MENETVKALNNARKQISKDLIIFGIIATILSILIIIGITYYEPTKSTSPSTEVEVPPVSTFDVVYSYILKLRLEHPDIVMAQCIQESGNFTSKLFLDGNNCTGMRCPAQRPTLAVGIIYGHAKFNSFKECLIDYGIWQQINCRGLSKTDYLKYLGRVYATDPKYEENILNVIKSNNL